MCNFRILLAISLLRWASAIVGPSANGTSDTYLDAYSKSRIEAVHAKKPVVITAKTEEKKIANREDSYSQGYDYTPQYNQDNDFSSYASTGPSSSGYLPPSKYGPPVEQSYPAPQKQYGPPAYGPPAPAYVPPAGSYGPPVQSFGPQGYPYGPPPVYGPPKPTYGVPYTAPMFGFLDKLSFKMDLLFIAKLLLKLLIFKKIVKTMAILCLLLVIPKLIQWKKGNGSNDDYQDRMMGNKPGTSELNSVQDFLDRAAAVYSRPGCHGVFCGARRIIEDADEFSPYFRFSPQ